ncbi:MAG: tetratricopeptide repeat protein [Cyanobacteria bacterium P01_A01_bin.83]
MLPSADELVEASFSVCSFTDDTSPDMRRRTESSLFRGQSRVLTKSDSLTKLEEKALPSEQELRKCVKAKASQGEYALAIAVLDQLIVLCPDNAADYNNRGLMHFRNNQIIEALCDLSQALELNPRLDSAYNNRANCYAAQGELTDAIADYDTALDLNPANLRAWINQGIAFRELGIYDLSIENFDITLTIGDVLQERIYAERGRTNYLRGDWNCAVADYRIALDLLAERKDLASYQLKVESWLEQLLNPINDSS